MWIFTAREQVGHEEKQKKSNSRFLINRVLIYFIFSDFDVFVQTDVVVSAVDFAWRERKRRVDQG